MEKGRETRGLDEKKVRANERQKEVQGMRHVGYGVRGLPRNGCGDQDFLYAE